MIYIVNCVATIVSSFFREIILAAEKVQNERAVLMAAMAAKKPMVAKKSGNAKPKSFF
jgi:hypothetical protein